MEAINNEEYMKTKLKIETLINKPLLEKAVSRKIKRVKAIQSIDLLIEFISSYYYFLNKYEHKESIEKAIDRVVNYMDYMGIKSNNKNEGEANKVKMKEREALINHLKFSFINHEDPYEYIVGLFYSLAGKEVMLNNSNESIIDVRASNIDYNELRIIGNNEARHRVETLINVLTAYDKEKGYNLLRRIVNYPFVLNLYGLPGTGKTALIRYAEQLLSKKYREKGIDTVIKYITMSDFSSYINKSAKQLEDLFTTINKSNDLYLVVIDEFETMFFSTRSTDDENVKVMGVLRRILGDTQRHKGNWAMIITSNEDLSNDSRLEPQIRSRLKGGAVLVPGVRTIEEYYELFKYKIEKGLRYGYFELSEKEIYDLSEKMHSLNFSGRDIEKIVEKASFKVITEKATMLSNEKEIVEALNKINYQGFKELINELVSQDNERLIL